MIGPIPQIEAAAAAETQSTGGTPASAGEFANLLLALAGVVGPEVAHGDGADQAEHDPVAASYGEENSLGLQPDESLSAETEAEPEAGLAAELGATQQGELAVEPDAQAPALSLAAATLPHANDPAFGPDAADEAVRSSEAERRPEASSPAPSEVQNPLSFTPAPAFVPERQPSASSLAQLADLPGAPEAPLPDQAALPSTLPSFAREGESQAPVESSAPPDELFAVQEAPAPEAAERQVAGGALPEALAAPLAQADAPQTLRAAGQPEARPQTIETSAVQATAQRESAGPEAALSSSLATVVNAPRPQVTVQAGGDGGVDLESRALNEAAALEAAGEGASERGSERGRDSGQSYNLAREAERALADALVASHNASTAPPAPEQPLQSAAGLSAALGPLASPALSESGAATPLQAPRSHYAAAADVVAQQAEVLATSGGGVVRLRLNPPELGQVEVSVSVRGGNVEISMRVDDPAVLLAVEGARDRLVDGMGARDLRVENFEVSLRDGADGGTSGEGRGSLFDRSAEGQTQASPDSGERPETERQHDDRPTGGSPTEANQSDPQHENPRATGFGIQSVDLRV